MRNTLLIILVLSSIVFAASFDRRSNNENQGEPVVRVEVPQMTFPNGVDAQVTDTINLNAIIEQITVTVNDNTGNVTFTVELQDDNGAVLWSQAAIPEDATTVYQNLTVSGSTLINMRIPVTNTITVAVSPSGDAGASTGLVDVVLYGG